MDFIYAGLVIFLIILALFLFQMAIQFIKLERKLENTVEILEEELVDVFGAFAFTTKVEKKVASVTTGEAKPAAKPKAPAKEAPAKNASGNSGGSKKSAAPRKK